MRATNQAALASLLQQRTAQTVKRGTSNPALEFGTMDASLNLVVDGLPSPLTQYMICKLMQGTLKAGDRVLVAWVAGTPVVIDILLAR